MNIEETGAVVTDENGKKRFRTELMPPKARIPTKKELVNLLLPE